MYLNPKRSPVSRCRCRSFLPRSSAACTCCWDRPSARLLTIVLNEALRIVFGIISSAPPTRSMAFSHSVHHLYAARHRRPGRRGLRPRLAPFPRRSRCAGNAGLTAGSRSLFAPICANLRQHRQEETRMLQMAGRIGVLGTETAFEVLARANALAAQGRSIINLGIGQPDFPTPAHIVEAGRKALADGHHGYTPANGIPRLREAVAADLYRRHGSRSRPTGCWSCPAARSRCFSPILMFGEPGAEILYPEPRLPDLRERDPLFRRDAGADPALRKRRVFVQRRRGAGQDHPAHPAADHQQPGQSDRRRGAAGRTRPSGRRARAPSASRGDERRDLWRDPL